MTGSRTSWASSTRTSVAVLALVLVGCVQTEPAAVILPPPGSSVGLSLDGSLRLQDLDELGPRLVAFVADVAPAGMPIALLVPGGDADVATESWTFAQALREAGYPVRRTHRRKLEPGETLVELFPIADGALQIDGGKARAWRVEIDARIFHRSDGPARATTRLLAEHKVAITQP